MTTIASQVQSFFKRVLDSTEWGHSRNSALESNDDDSQTTQDEASKTVSLKQTWRIGSEGEEVGCRIVLSSLPSGVPITSDVLKTIAENMSTIDSRYKDVYVPEMVKTIKRAKCRGSVCTSKRSKNLKRLIHGRHGSRRRDDKDVQPTSKPGELRYKFTDVAEIVED